MDQKRKRLTVVYVDASVGFGGSSKSLSLTLRALSGVSKLLYTTQRPDIVGELFGDIEVRSFRRRINYRTRIHLREFLTARVRMRYLPKAVFSLYALTDVIVAWITTARLWFTIKDRGVDLVHVNNGFFPEALWAARLARVPSIVHMRGFPSTPFPRPLQRLAAHVGCVITVSDAVADVLRNEIPGDRLVTIYDSVDVHDAEAARHRRASIREQLGATDRNVLFGIFGRVVEWKGQLEFVQAALVAMSVNPEIRAVIVGDASDGTDAYVHSVHLLVHDSQFADRFILTGYRSDVAALYAAMDVAVHASILPEPFGMVIPEAMAAGTPVIATDAGGPKEIVRHGIDGLLVCPGDVAGLSEAMLELAADPVRRRAMGEHGRKAVRDRFTVEKNAHEVQRIYERLVGVVDEPGIADALTGAQQ